MFTSGYELMTSLTNFLIFIISIYCIFNYKNNNKMWKRFFICLLFDSFLGVIIHGIVMSESMVNFLWIILSLIFSITINILLTIFLKEKYSNINDNLPIIFSFALYLIIIIEFIVGIDFLNTFIIYACICILIVLYICVYIYLKDKSFSYQCFLFALFFQILGGLFLINKDYHYDFFMLDKNGIYHLFMVCSEIFFYKGAKSI